MPADNVVDATARFASQVANGERKPAPSALDRAMANGERKLAPSALDRAVEQLRSMARVAHADRPLLASGLGRLASQISPGAPLEGAKMMFRRAGNAWQAKWPKRRRLIRLPHEPAEQNYDHGAFEGGGSAYLALADAAAAILAGDGTATPRDRERARREILRGSSFMPESAPLAASAFAVRELLDEWALRLRLRIQTETRLPELVQILQNAPFTTQVLRAVEELKDGKWCTIQTKERVIENAKVEPAGEVSLLATTISQFRYKKGVTLAFSPTDKSEKLYWMQPAVQIGRLLAKVTIPTFVFPPHIATFLSASTFYANDAHLPNEVIEWLISIGCGTQTANNKWRRHVRKPDSKTVIHIDIDPLASAMLPDIEWSKESQFGWRDLEYFYAANVFFVLAVTDNDIEPTVFVNRCDSDVEDFYVPAFGDDAEKNSYKHFSDPDRSEFFPSYFSSLGENYKIIHWPRDYAEKGGSIIGLVDFYPSDRPFEEGANGWLDHPAVAALFLSADRWRFFPEITCPPAPVPCAAQSVAAAVLRNLAGAPKELRLDNMLIDQAKAISKAGLAYHEALVDHYRSAVAKP